MRLLGRRRLWHGPDARHYAMDSEDAATAGKPSEGLEQSRQVTTQPDAPSPEGGGGDMLKASMAARQIDRWLQSMERLRLADYVRYVDDRKRMFWSSFWGGVARGVGMAVGFTILGAVLIMILQNLARHNLPVIGDFLAQIVSVVQTRLK